MVAAAWAARVRVLAAGWGPRPALYSAAGRGGGRVRGARRQRRGSRGSAERGGAWGLAEPGAVSHRQGF